MVPAQHRLGAVPAQHRHRAVPAQHDLRWCRRSTASELCRRSTAGAARAGAAWPRSCAGAAPQKCCAGSAPPQSCAGAARPLQMVLAQHGLRAVPAQHEPAQHGLKSSVGARPRELCQRSTAAADGAGSATASRALLAQHGLGAGSLHLELPKRQLHSHVDAGAEQVHQRTTQPPAEVASAVQRHVRLCRLHTRCMGLHCSQQGTLRFGTNC